MAIQKLRGKDLLKIGYPQGKVIGLALNTMTENYKRMPVEDQLALLANVQEKPEDYINDEVLGRIARELKADKKKSEAIELHPERMEYRVYGAENIDAGAIGQMDTAMRLPVAVAGALMPDAHHGYGLPIGGVLATENAIIPYAVGVDIGCRMCLTIYPKPAGYIAGHRSELKKHLEENTRFGAGEGFKDPLDHEIFERKEFREIGMVKRLKDKAYNQIGSSGSGNHFVEFGSLRIAGGENEFGLEAGEYLAILSHSGSRGLGANIASHYTRLARELCKLPKEAQHLAWLDLDTEAGQEYWLAMNLAGDYASACHHQIHYRLARALGMEPLAMVENHHNFAWKEQLPDGREVIVHRKGATPAGKGVLGIIPGSMTSPGFVVRGKGEAASLSSAAHGAGRVMSRRQAMQSITKKEVKQILQHHGVELIGGGLDEAPMVYKDIHQVMASQHELVEVVASFTPKIVRMDKN